jgi:hypothetical protein
VEVDGSLAREKGEREGVPALGDEAVVMRVRIVGPESEKRPQATSMYI